MKKIILFIAIFITFQGVLATETKKSEVKLENKHLIVDGKIPVFYNNGKYLGDSSSRAKGSFTALMEMVKMEAKRNFLENPDEENSKFILKSDFKKIKNENQIESYSVKSFYYTGGKHGMVLEEGYNFKDGREIFLEDLFKNNINYRGLIKQKVEEQIIKYGGDLYYSDIDIPNDGYSFYFKEDSLVILFNPYTLASYEAGVITFEIPVSEISAFMKI